MLPSNSNKASLRRVPLSGVLERDGALNDECEKNTVLDAALVFESFARTTVPEPFALEKIRCAGVALGGGEPDAREAWPGRNRHRSREPFGGWARMWVEEVTPFTRTHRLEDVPVNLMRYTLRGAL